MPVPAGYSQIRSGFIEVGDFLYNSQLAVYIEVHNESSFVGSPVRNHKQVWRNLDARAAAAQASTPLSHTDLCDELQEFDAVVLREGGFYDNHRMVVYKDEQFIYLRKLANQPGSQTSDRVCRRTGKAWAWTPGGWEPKDWTLNKGTPLAVGGFVGKSYVDGGLVGA